jgi:hypothetical protein
MFLLLIASGLVIVAFLYGFILLWLMKRTYRCTWRQAWNILMGP